MQGAVVPDAAEADWAEAAGKDALGRVVPKEYRRWRRMTTRPHPSGWPMCRRSGEQAWLACCSGGRWHVRR